MSESADYKKTIRLPRTAFPMRANLAQREPQTLQRWEREQVYERALSARASAERFVFHDGPPYANGHIHYGHILNKLLKDFVVKYHTLAGRLIRFVPGWDCHGLPIELNVEREFKRKGRQPVAAAVRAACRAEAEKWVKTQTKEFNRLGVFGTWEHPYLTLDPKYEQGIIEALMAFIRHGLVYRGKKPVHWCSRCETALAEAEVEYQDHQSPSIYVRFPVEGAALTRLRESLPLGPRERALPIHALIWTTTPWTLPANLAIAVHPDFDYTAVDVGGELWLVAEGLAEAVLSATGVQAASRSAAVKGLVLVGVEARHPFEDRSAPLLAADYVTLEAGTGLVHTAPGHGADDYRLGQEHGLEAFAPVDDAGKFTDEVRSPWRGKHVLEANPDIVRFLDETGALANPAGQTISHSYPCCWRCKTPIVFRATTQWFIALDRPMIALPGAPTLRQVALREIDAIAAGRDIEAGPLESGWIPAWGRDRIHGMLSDRPDWCISRQRVWGVPIPALHCKQCGDALLDETLGAHAAKLFGREGADAWFTREASELIPPDYRCRCGSTDLEKDHSILDVWFESGASFWSTMRSEEDGYGLPVDLYLEGSDQHRGWFHSSLLVGAAVLGRAPYKRVLTHGFVCDDQGRPYSKSEIRRRREAGEEVDYIEPDDVLKQQGAELLRLWVAYEDFRNDVRYSSEHLKQVSDAYFKIRNTLRFLLGNLDGYDGEQPEEIDPLDAWARARLRRYVTEVVDAYERYDFRTVYHRTVGLCSGEWSSFYLDVVKDRLYCDAPDSQRRVSCQATLERIARGTIVALGPITAFTADEAWRHLPGKQTGELFIDGRLITPEPVEGDAALLEAGRRLFEIRDVVNLAIEDRVKAKDIGHRREVAVMLTIPEADRELLARMGPDLAEILAVASVQILSGSDIAASITRTSAARCARCWRHRTDVGEDHAELCQRCAAVVGGS